MRSTELPPAARDKLEEYVQEKLMGKYGHPRQRLRRFRDQLLSFPDAATSQRNKGPATKVLIMAEGLQTADWTRVWNLT